MAGGKIIRITGGNFETKLSGGMEVHTDTFDIAAGKQNRLGGKEGTVMGKPKKPKTGSKHIIRGWWSADKEGKKTIREAVLGDIVYFHVETKDVPDDDVVFMSLYDDDVKRAKEEKDRHKGSDRIVLNNKQDDFEKVKANKVIKAINLRNFSSWVAEEEDKAIELYFACSYKGKDVELPVQFHDYLKVKGMPKIIIVNGQWNIAANVPFGIGESFGPIKPKKPYWVGGFADAAIEYFNSEFKVNKKYSINGSPLASDELEKRNFILYYDGSSKYAGDQSGGDRFENGSTFAQKNFEEITSGLGGQEVYFVSHSEGGAYAAGMANYLFSRGIKIGEHVLLSPDEGNEFSINPKIPSYQLLYMFFSSIYNPIGTKIKLVKFKRWGSYYAVVDWVVNEHKIKGITKMGIVHYQRAGWDGIHGWTNGKEVFNKVADLKDVVTFNAIGEYDKKVYSGKQQTEVANKTKFYRIGDDYIIFNCPPIIKIK